MPAGCSPAAVLSCVQGKVSSAQGAEMSEGALADVGPLLTTAASAYRRLFSTAVAAGMEVPYEANLSNVGSLVWLEQAAGEAWLVRWQQCTLLPGVLCSLLGVAPGDVRHEVQPWCCRVMSLRCGSVRLTAADWCGCAGIPRMVVG